MAPPDVAFPNPAGRPQRPYPSDLAILLTKYFKPYQIPLTLNYLIIDLTQFCTYVLCPSILTFPDAGIFIVLRLCQRLILVIPSPSLSVTLEKRALFSSQIFFNFVSYVFMLTVLLILVANEILKVVRQKFIAEK